MQLDVVSEHTLWFAHVMSIILELKQLIQLNTAIKATNGRKQKWSL